MRLRWVNDPVAYARDALGTEPWSGQEEILRAVQEHPRVAVRSGHKIGKSRCAGTIASWWVDTRPNGWVIMTSSSARQVKSILWEEFRKLREQAPHSLGPPIALDPGTGYRSATGGRVQGFSTDKPERFAGFSGAELLFILDEASGINEPIFEAIEGNRAGGARVVMFSNPTQTVGTFYDSFNSKRAFWKTIHISSEETPNVLTGRVVVPGLANLDWVNEKKAEWGEDSPLYQVRVRGNFPSQGSNAVIGIAILEAAEKAWLTTPAEGALEFGVDPARFGDDDSVICPRRGKKILPLLAFAGKDGVQLAGEVLKAIRELRHPNERPRVKVDVIGVGASCADQLRQHPTELELVEVNSSESATSERYHRLRDQLWFAGRDFLAEGGALPPDPKLARDLVAPRYGFDAQGRYQVESKAETKKTLGHSPDRADAFNLSVYSPAVSTAPAPEDDFDDFIPLPAF